VGEAVGLAISPDGSHLYVSHYRSSGTVSVIDTTTDTIVDTINVGRVPEYLAVAPAPPAPQLALAVDSGISNSDDVTNVGTVVVKGLLNGATWQYSTDNGTTWINGINDTFVFASNFGHSTIEGFTAAGPGQDTIQLSKSVFDSFASVLAHASQVGQDVVISSGSDTLKLLNTNLSALNSQDFNFA
jgi:YVTN family beta-propeller protein